MKKFLPALTFVFFSFILFKPSQSFAQCVNADFESGNFTGWTGTWGDGATRNVSIGGIPVPYCDYPDPYQHTGINLGPLNCGPYYTPLENQAIVNNGNDPWLTGMGYSLPVVFPGGGAYSARLGNAHANETVGGLNGHGGGESLTYSFTVTPNNVNFTYHYAAILNDGHHNPGQQPYFQIRMYDGSNNPINCASYDVDATTAASIGGFVHPGVVTDVWIKPWTSVFIPLNSYIGQTVKITFTTRDCSPGVDSTVCVPIIGPCFSFLNLLCEGSHYAYAYIDAECAPLQLVASSPSVCGGQGITLTAPAGAATYAWTGPGVVPPTDSQTVVVNQPGTYHVTMTVLGQCSSTFTIDTTIAGSPQNPVANFTATTVCAGNPTQFTDASTPAGSITSWAWDFDNNGTTDATTQSPTHTYAAAGTYQVKLTVGWPPCTDDTTITVTVSPAPNSTFTATGPVCLGANSTITYTGNAPGNATYTWNFDGGTIASGSGQGPYSVNWSTGGVKNITLTVSIGGCVSSQTTVPVTVNNAVGITVSPNVTICQGASTPLTASGGSSYTWSPATGLSATTGAIVTASPTTTTTYSVTDVNASCTSPASVLVTVNPVPTSSVTASSPVCAGQNSTITYTGNASANATYTWNFAGGTVVSGSGQGPYSVNWTTAGVQNITLTVSENGCTSTPTSVSVTVNPGPTASFTVISPVCTGQNSTITYTGTGTGSTNYTWSFDGGTVVSGSGAGPYSVNWSTAGTKNIILTVNENNCTATNTVSVVVGNLPTPTFTVTSPVCTGQNSTITYTGNAPSGATYTWDFDQGTVASGSGQGPYDINWSTPGVKNVTLIVDDNGCTSPQSSMAVTVGQTPVVNAGTDFGVCADTTQIQLNGSPSGGTWSGTGIALPDKFDVPTAGAGSFTLTYTVVDNVAGCTGSDNLTATVTPLPNVNAGADVQVCAGNSIQLTATGASNYIWSPSTGLNNTNTGNPTASPANTTTYSVTGTDANGCDNTDDVIVSVIPVPLSDFTAQPVCAGEQVIFVNNSTGNGSQTYFWQFGDGSTDATANPAHTYGNGGTYNVTLTVSEGGCSNTYTFNLDIYSLPVADFSAFPVTVSLGETIALTNVSTNATQYFWDLGNGTTSVITSPQVLYSQIGSYTITLIASNGSCFDTVSKTVLVTEPSTIFIPNSFSPNGDGNNDLFLIYGSNIRELYVDVFNRWGEKVFSSLNQFEGWDGTYKGQLQTPQVFVYKVKAVFFDSKVHNYKGSLTLLR